MPTHSQLAAQLLRDAAAFFRTIAQQNEPLKAQMEENASVFDEVAMLVETNPLAEISAPPHSHHDHSHEGGCCGGHDHGHDHDHDDAHCGSDGKKEGCSGKGNCSH